MTKDLKLKAWLVTSLVVQWLGCQAPNAGGPGSIPGQGTRSHMHATTKSPHAATKRSCMKQLKDLACHSEDPAHGNEDPTCRN